MNQTPAPAIVVLTAAALPLARRIAAVLPGSEVHGLTERVEGAERTFAETARHLRALFAAGHPIIGLCAAGILIRAVAPTLADKRAEPPVLAVAEDGSAVVPLLGGHRGANRFARDIAVALGIDPAITTAGDLRFGLALDAPPAGWRLANLGDHKAFAAALLNGAGVRLTGEADWLEDTALPWRHDGALEIVATERRVAGAPLRLVYHPQILCLGVGCARGAPAAEVIALVREALEANDLAENAVAVVVSLDLKADEGAVHAVAQALGVPARFFDAARLEEETPRLENPSDLVFAEVGCHGVAEAAALAAAAPDGALIVPKVKTANATCAVARASQPVDSTTIGQGRGSLAVVGLGPGDPIWRTAEAEAALARATDLVGYRLYLDLVGSAAAGKRRHDFALGEEEARVRRALDLAAAGRDVALVCSGDPGIYAMAALVFELIERGGERAWRRPDIAIVPGLSALQAAAARAGAPLGHDFCAISLSDLLTPWPVIERRLHAAAEGDFVVALYNPVSQRRTHQLTRAKEILRPHRRRETPVVLARNLGRDGETVTVTDLDTLSPEQVDMLTVVLIGSNETRRIDRDGDGAWVYTPRGYEAKASGGKEDAA